MERKWVKKAVAAVVTCTLAFGVFAASNTPVASANNVSSGQISKQGQAAIPKTAPKYVFLFIGDGMSYPQIQTASDYLGAMKQGTAPAILKGGEPLSFMNFPIAGSATTFDSTSFAPDSASTATSIATGYKTHSGVVNMDETKKIAYETVSEKVKKQLGYKVGVVSTVNLNHATPAAFYAHQSSRNNYYAIGQEMVNSGFDYFAGGGLIDATGKNKDQKSIYDLAEQAGYNVVMTQAEAEKISAKDGKTIIIGETLADSNALSYANDRKNNEWALADYVKKGIDVLDNEQGFFMMVEGGKIDWACHANDAGSTIADTVALNEAINEAVAFYEKHPQETLILVTGDHETGGLTIGYAGTDYDTFLTNLSNQKISYAKYDSDYVSKYKVNKTPFETVLKDIKQCFGLMVATDPEAASNAKLVLTDYEYAQLKAAYDKTMSGKAIERSNQKEYVLYGTYEPLTVTITHLLNNKSGINFSSYSHTGLPVPVFALGMGQDMFDGYYDNTDIYDNLAAIMRIK